MAQIIKPLLLSHDSSLSLPLIDIAIELNRTCKTLRFVANPTVINLGEELLSNPRTYKAISNVTDPLLLAHSGILVASQLPYDNNYFIDSDTDVVIASFYEWSHLTNLPISNGFIGFILGLLANEIQDDAPRHEENTGCIYDFLWDKSGIDMRLRGAAICRTCLHRIQSFISKNGSRKMSIFDCSIIDGFEDMKCLMDDISTASRREMDILSFWKSKADQIDGFDVFLCHSSDDKPSVRNLYKELISKNIKPWFDEENLVPGTPWQDELQATIPKIRTVAVIVGPNGRGPWQDMELRAFLSEFANRGCRIIPVILPDAANVPELPLFLRQFTWVDFRRTDHSAFDRLIWGITGHRPKPD